MHESNRLPLLRRKSSVNDDGDAFGESEKSAGFRRLADDARNSRLAAILTSSDDAIISKSLSGVVMDWNLGAERIFGFTAAEAVGQSIAIIIPEDRAEEEPAILNRLRHGERIDHFETRRRRKDGEIIDVSVTISPLRDSHGMLIGASKIARDITAAKRAQAALQEREAYAKLVLNTVPDAMIVMSADGIIESFSVTAEKLFGYPAAAAVGRNISLFIQAPARSGASIADRLGFATTGFRRDGTAFPVEFAVGEARTENRLLLIGFARDLTERRLAETRLRELQAELIHVSRFTAMGEMAATLAHELNQPLAAVANYLNGGRRLLDSGQSDAVKLAREAMENAAAQALRAGQIIRRLRDFVARGESEQRVENLPNLIEEASALALVGLKETGVTVISQLDPSAPTVLADKVQIQQVLLNLIRNGIEAMETATTKRLVIATRLADPATVEISVADSGTGIAPPIMAQLFQPFVTTKKSGMGVGLSISRTIVAAHDGRLSAEPNPGGGTVFKFTLKAPSVEAND